MVSILGKMAWAIASKLFAQEVLEEVLIWGLRKWAASDKADKWRDEVVDQIEIALNGKLKAKG